MSDFELDPRSCLIGVMVFMSAADRNMTDKELFVIGDIVKTLPVFRDFDENKLISTAQAAAAMLEKAGSLEAAIAVINESLPKRLHETAYCVACEVAAADGQVALEEMRALEIMRDGLGIDRLTSAAIERGVRARYTSL